jgi:hypothetical protein
MNIMLGLMMAGI